MGRIAILTEDERDWLSVHVEDNIYAKASYIQWSLYQQHTEKRLSIRIIMRTLGQQGFSYKKTKLVPVLNKIQEQSRKSGKIHIIADNVRYNHSKNCAGIC